MAKTLNEHIFFSCVYVPCVHLLDFCLLIIIIIIISLQHLENNTKKSEHETEMPYSLKFEQWPKWNVIWNEIDINTKYLHTPHLYVHINII